MGSPHSKRKQLHSTGSSVNASEHAQENIRFTNKDSSHGSRSCDSLNRNYLDVTSASTDPSFHSYSRSASSGSPTTIRNDKRDKHIDSIAMYKLLTTAWIRSHGLCGVQFVAVHIMETITEYQLEQRHIFCVMAAESMSALNVVDMNNVRHSLHRSQSTTFNLGYDTNGIHLVSSPFNLPLSVRNEHKLDDGQRSSWYTLFKCGSSTDAKCSALIIPKHQFQRKTYSKNS